MTDSDTSTAPVRPILELEGLQVVFAHRGEQVQAVSDASIVVPAGGSVGLVGESGSGKSTLARTLMGLHAGTSAQAWARRYVVNGQTVDISDGAQVARLRGGTIAMVFQDPLSYLNPLMKVGAQIGEAIALHDPGSAPAARTAQLLDLVRLSAHVAGSYPHELSGGMRQRALLAIALGCKPRLLVADEPTTALDASTQAGILTLLGDLRRELGVALLFISHDLGAVAHLCETVYVMYAGKTIECGPRADVFDAPKHPYTQGLLLASRARRGADGRYYAMPGEIPGAVSAPGAAGRCAFLPRCAQRLPQCHESLPGFDAPPPRHTARCWLGKEFA